MIEWRLKQSTIVDRWNVAEYSNGLFQRHIMVAFDKATAGRIAKLLELEAVVDLAIKWQKSFVFGRDVSDEGFSVADETAEQALYDAAQAAGDGEGL